MNKCNLREKLIGLEFVDRHGNETRITDFYKNNDNKIWCYCQTLDKAIGYNCHLAELLGLEE